MEFYEKDFGKILKANALKQRRMMLQYGTECMRVYDRNLEQFPVTVDLYGKYARITDYSVDGMEEAMKETCCDIVSRMLYVQSDHVVFYHREKRTGREQHEVLSDVSVKTQVKENGLTFTVDLTRHIDTGLFLDHAVTREWVRENCLGLSVLNLFSYTGAFSVYAAAGGAASVVSVDLSGPYTQWAKENLKANGFEGDLYPCVQMDALKFVEQELAKGSKYQLIIFDPPTFSNSHKMDGDFDVQRDYAKWFWLLNGLLVQGGKIVFSNNLGNFRLDAGKVHGYAIEEVSREVAAPGFTKKTGTSRTWLLTKMEEAGPRPEDIADFGVVAGKNLQEEQIMSEELKDQEAVVMETAEEKKPARKTTRKSTAKKAVKSETETEKTAPKAKRTTRKSTKKTATEPVAEEPKAEEAPAEETKAEEPAVEKPKAEEAPAEETKAEEPAVEEPKAEEAPAQETKAEEPAVEEPKAEEAPAEETKAEEPAVEEAKADDDVLTLDWSDNEEESQPAASSDDQAEEAEEEDKEESVPEADDRMAIAARAFQPRPYGGRPEKNDDGDEEDRPARRGGRDRDDRGNDRRSYGDRDDRGYGRRDFGDRDDRGYGRRSYGDRDDRGYGRRSYGDRDDRGYGRRDFDDRDDRGFGRRSYGDRDDRGFGRKDDRDARGFGRRDGFSRPSRYNDRDDRRGGQKPYGMDKFRPSGARRAEEEGKSFFWLEKDGKKNDDEQ
ncbi:MAG: class I SAM-dependent methyltransferase [Spirochaetales bacterium]|nr:class I SAM-dependent methyltransferase [Spirochaetales bacterium]